MEIENLFKQYLKEDEHILWTGQPKGGIQIRDADMLLIPMSIILVGFSIILNYTLMHYESSFTFKILGILLAIAGIYIGIIRFFSSAARRARTYYCITSRRVIVLRGRRKKKIKTLPLKNIDRIDNTMEKDGSGFIIFGSANPLYPWLFGGFYFAGDDVPGLEWLPDVDIVYRLLLNHIKIDITPSLAAEIRKEKDEGDLN